MCHNTDTSDTERTGHSSFSWSIFNSAHTHCLFVCCKLKGLKHFIFLFFFTAIVTINAEPGNLLWHNNETDSSVKPISHRLWAVTCKHLLAFWISSVSVIWQTTWRRHPGLWKFLAGVFSQYSHKQRPKSTDHKRSSISIHDLLTLTALALFCEPRTTPVAL